MKKLQNILSILESKVVLNVIVSISLVLSIYSGYNQELIKATIISSVGLGIVGYFGLKRAKRTDWGYIKSLDTVQILFFGNSNTNTVFQDIKNHYDHDNLKFKFYDVNDSNNLEKFKLDLKQSTGVYIEWLDNMNSYESHLEELKEWGNQNRSNPILIISNKNIDQLENNGLFEKYIEKKYQLIQQDDLKDSLWQLLIRSIQRGRKWIRIANFWRRLTIFSTFIFILSAAYNITTSNQKDLLSSSAFNNIIDSKRKFSEVQETLAKVYSNQNGYIFNDSTLDLQIEKEKVRKAISTYFLYAEEDIASKTKERTKVKISLWRELTNDTIYSTIPDDVTIPFFKIDKNSIIGCSLLNEGFALWKKNYGLNKDAFWNLEGKLIGKWNNKENKIVLNNDNSVFCQYYNEPEALKGYKRDGILCLTIKSDNGIINGLCFDAIENAEILNEEWIRDYMIKLSVFTTHIPNEVFQN